MGIVDEFVKKLISDLREKATESVVEYLEEHYDDIRNAVEDILNPKIDNALCEIHKDKDDIIVVVEYAGFYSKKVKSVTLNNNVLTIVLGGDSGGE